MNYWLLFALLPPLLWAFTNVGDALVRRHYIKNDITLTWLLTALRLPIAIIMFLFLGMDVAFDLNVWWMFVAGLLWTLPIIFYFRALNFEEISRVVILMQMIPVFVLVFASQFLDEILSVNQLIAFGLIFVAGILAAFKKTQKTWHFSAAFFLMALASSMWAASDVMFTYYEETFNSFMEAFVFYFLGSNIPALFILFVPQKAKKIFSEFKKIPFKMWIFIFFNGIIGVFGSLTLAYAFTLGSVSLTSVFIGLQPLFAFIYALILGRFYKQIPKESLKREDLLFKGSALALVFAGLIYLNL